MNKKAFYIAAAIVVCVLLLGGGYCFSGSKQGEESGGIRWYSYEEGIEKIKKSDRQGYLHFYTDWCGYCKKMEKETFSDGDVISDLNEDFVSIKVNADKKPKIARQYGANQFPFNWFISKKNDPIGNQPGFIPPAMMVHILKYVSAEDYKSMQFDEFMEKRE
ncbi:MAG: thioredoxin family protein [Desulfobacterales bacterium]